MIFKRKSFKKLAALSMILALSAASVMAAGTLTISPDKPTTGSQITLTYKPEKTAVSSDRVRAFVYTFTEMRSVPKGDEVLLSYDATLKAFKGVYSLEKDVVFGLLKIATPTEMDNNKENFWDFLVHDASGKPLRGAQMRAGISYLGNLPTQAKRNVDISRGLNYIQNESTAYPDNIQAQIGALSLRFENKQIEKAAFDEQLGKIVNTPFDKTRENDLRAVTRALKIMNENDRAAQLENEFMVKFPKSELAEEIAVGKLSAAKSEQEFATAAQSFISTFPASVYTERVFTALLNIYLQQGKVDEAKAVLSRLNSVPASAYNQIAFTISEKGLELADALAWNDRALKDAEMPNLERKPIFVTPSEWAEAGQQTTGAILFTRGAILNKMGQSAQALETFTKAKAALGENTPVELYSALVSVHESTGNHREAYEVASEAIRLSKSNNEIAARHKALYASLHPKAKDYDKVLSGFSADASKSRRAKVASEKMMMVSPLPNETMSTFDGRQVSLNDLKGKIVILDFWATWCGPCRQSFPAMQKLYEKYKSNPNVVFAIVNVWEREKDRKKVAKDYLDKNPNFTFPVYFDEDDAIVKSFGVTGIPTKFYLDKNGLVQFKEVGFAGEEGFLRDAEDKIEVLLKEG